MDQNALRTFIKQLSAKTTEEDVTFLINWAELRELKKGDILLQEGEICRCFYFVEKGYLRTWYNKDGAAINLNFTFEGDCTTNLKSIKNKQPSELNIEAGEDTSLRVFDLGFVNAQLISYPAINSFVRRMAFHLLLAAEEHSKLFKMYTPTERYRYVEQHNPQLIQRISLSQIASYLGVARETLSRIRAKTH